MRKQVVVIGLGQFGTHLARKLSELKCEVLALDRREALVAELRDEVHRAIVGDAKSLDTLQSILTPSIDEAVVSLGESMEASILCTLHLGQIGVKHIRAKAVNEDHARILRAVGAHEVIFPERETAERTATRIAFPSLLDYFPLAGEYRIMEIATPDHLAGKTLKESDLRSVYRLLVLAIKKGGREEYDFMPDPTDVLADDDVLVVLGREVDLARIRAAD